MILFPEMSVDSDRDSVIDSEDGKEAVVRPFFLFIHSIFFTSYTRKFKISFHSFICFTAFR